VVFLGGSVQSGSALNLDCQEQTMKIKALLMTMLAALFLVAGACNQSTRRSEGDAVKQALEQADLKGVTVTDDADKNTVTLGGTLHSAEAKNRAGEVAKTAASDRTIANEISVQPVGDESQAKSEQSNLDDAIESNYKAALVANRLNKQSIHYDAKNGVLTLKGNVKTTQQKAEAEQLASKIPNVQQVVNQIDVNR
jgi:hyperosmotically inducible periplasmic protein